jgi:peptide deformylase
MGLAHDVSIHAPFGANLEEVTPLSNEFYSPCPLPSQHPRHQRQTVLAKVAKIYPSVVLFVLLFAMPVLSILRFPDPRLHQVARPVQQVDASLQPLIDSMFETMYAAKGIGLAATQVDVHLRLIVMDVSDTRTEPLVLINPVITWASSEREKNDEGCLSVPGIYDGVERAVAVRVEALDRHGQPQVIAADGLLAVCIQHEMDHLMGKVFVEYLSPLKRNRIKTRLLKEEREEHKQDKEAS